MQKKQHFAHPGTTAKQILETNDTGHEQKGATKKKKQSPDSLTAALDRDAHSLLFRADFSGWCFFFAAARRGRSLTHCGPGRRCLPPGWCFFFAAAPPGPGWCFFFCCGPARTLTRSLWAGAISARPWCFCFCCGPAEPGEPITKNVGCTTSGLKRPHPAGPQQKKTPLPRRECCMLWSLSISNQLCRRRLAWPTTNVLKQKIESLVLVGP